MDVDEYVYVYRVDARDFLNNKKKIVIALDDLDKHTVHSGKQVSLLSKQVAASGREGVNAFSALSKAALAFFGASLTLGGITGLLGGMSRTLTQLGNQSAYLAIPARRLDGLSRAAEAAGSSTGALMTQLKNLRDSQAWLRAGITDVNDYTLALSQLQGVTGVDIIGATSPDEAFARVGQALRSLKNADLCLQYANRLGLDAGLQRSINDQTFDRNASTFTRNSRLTPALIAQAQRVNAQLEDLKQQMGILSLQAYDAIIPIAEALMPILKDLIKTVADHGDDIAAFFTSGAAGIQDFTAAVGVAENAMKLLLAAWVAVKAKGLLTGGAAGAAGRAGALGAALTATGAYVTTASGVEVWERLKALKDGRHYGGIATQSEEMRELARLKRHNLAVNSAQVEQHAQSARLSRGIRNNNPGNIEFRRQQGATGSDGRYAIFETPYTGIKALSGQLMRYYSGQTTGRPLRTVNDIISTWAPASENNTAAYIAQVSKALGVEAQTRLDLNDNAVMQKLVSAIIRHENGTNPYDALTLAKAVADSRTDNPQMAAYYPQQQRALQQAQTVNHSQRVSHTVTENHIQNVNVTTNTAQADVLLEQIQQKARQSQLTAPYISGVMP
ncbi:hypothetical protein SODG_001436 [Sodalis praecaptivus]